MDTGAGVVVAPIGLVLDLDPISFDLGFQVASLRQRQVLEDRPVGVAGDDGNVNPPSRNSPCALCWR